MESLQVSSSESLSKSESTASSTRRFPVEPVETISKSNRPSSAKESAATPSCLARNFVPQLEASSTKRTRRRDAHTTPETNPQPGLAKSSLESSSNIANEQKSVRFLPQLIETTRRSRKVGDTRPVSQPTDRTDLSPGDPIHLPRHLRLARAAISPMVAQTIIAYGIDDGICRAPGSRFSSAALSRKAPRRTSFRVPDLPPINSQPDSEESIESNCPSLSTSPSAASDETELYKHASRIRESCDDRFSGYLFALAARATEKQLREQAMAAYPNEKIHEPVEHFAIDRESDTSDEEPEVRPLLQSIKGETQAPRRDSARVWNLAEARWHKEALVQPKIQTAVKNPPQSGEASSLKAPTQALDKGSRQAIENTVVPRVVVTDVQKGAGLSRMRSAASPPMLGRDLIFPKCLSPQPTNFDATQYPSAKPEEGIKSRQHSGLWTLQGPSTPGDPAAGLWNGVCSVAYQDNLSAQNQLQNGLMTPKAESEDPFSSFVLSFGEHQLPPSPQALGGSKVAKIDSILSVEQNVDKEFHDGFVTQIYNYLSLGYPSLARRFDDELSKISRVPIEDLRRDDGRKITTGYVGAPERSVVDKESVLGVQCGRWVALRLYIREWARQQPGMADQGSRVHDDWGSRARRGSWAI